MSRKLVLGACALALAALTGPVAAQQTETGGAAGQAGGSEGQTTTGTSDQTAAGGETTTGADPREGARQQAEQVGIKDVSEVQGAFVLQGTSPTAIPIFMIVGPSGELLAMAAPIVQSGTPAGTETGAAESQTSTADAPKAGEPAQSGYMATQAQPASPDMWDPEMVTRRLFGMKRTRHQAER